MASGRERYYAALRDRLSGIVAASAAWSA
jgi:hypothetical protein